MTSTDLEHARIYAEALLIRAEYRNAGSAKDLRNMLKAIEELQALREMPRALPDAQRAA